MPSQHMQPHEKVIEYLSQAFLIVVGALGVLVSVLDFVGADFVNGPWKWLKGPQPVMLSILGILALAIGLERYARLRHVNRKLEKMETDLEDYLRRVPDQIITALNGVEVRRFDNSRDMYEYVTGSLKQAKTKIYDLTWGDIKEEKTIPAKRAFEDYVRTIKEICQNNNNLIYREVMSFLPNDSLGHMKRARLMLTEKMYNYHLRYYEFRPEQMPPLLSFMVVDATEVIMAFWGETRHAESEVQLAIKHPGIVNFFEDFYEAIWQAATDVENREELAAIKKRLCPDADDEPEQPPPVRRIPRPRR